MAIDYTERNARTDGPIHGWFGLTYSNYLVLHRSMMQSMPVAWQERAVALFDELDRAFPDLKRPPSFIVTAASEREYGDLNGAEMAALGVTQADRDPDLTEEERVTADGLYHDRDGDPHESWERLLVPLPGGDPVPHYNRGRTFIEPAG